MLMMVVDICDIDIESDIFKSLLAQDPHALSLASQRWILSVTSLLVFMEWALNSARISGTHSAVI